MMKLLKSLPLLIFAIILIVWMVSNRQGITINLFPLPYEILLPAYLILFVGIFIGLAFGAYVLAARRMRAAADIHQLKREIARLNSQNGDLKAQLRTQEEAEDRPQISS